jgi:uncharacterized membrane protein
LSFPKGTRDIWEPFQALSNGLHTYSLLFLGAFTGIVAVWIDKWVMWLGPSGEAAVGGLLNAPGYDSAMFVAYLSIIPSLGILVSTLETAFFDRYTHYFRSIQNHATLDCIIKNGNELSSLTISLIKNTMLFQAVICALILTSAPLIAPIFGLNYQQIGILRIGAIGALFQFLFLVCTSLLLYFERYASYAKLQILFLVTSAAGTAATLLLGSSTYGLGFLAASVLSSVPALFVLEKTMADLGYLTFVVGNAKTASYPRLGRKLWHSAFFLKRRAS